MVPVPIVSPELWRALAVLAEEPRAEHGTVLEALGLGPGPTAVEHTDLFAFQLFPWASIYLGEEGQAGGEARDRIAGFWRALGATPPPEPDHLAVLLAAYADLAERDDEPRARHARRAFFWEHLASWLPAWLARARELATGFHRRWADLAAEALAAEAAALNGAPAEAAAALRTAPAVADPRSAGAEPFLAALLAPVRSGLLLARDDLRRAARELALAARPGERRWVLSALLGQAPAPVLAWLAAEARRQRDLWAAAFPPGAARDHWSGRAAATASLLDELARDAT